MFRILRHLCRNSIKKAPVVRGLNMVSIPLPALVPQGKSKVKEGIKFLLCFHFDGQCREFFLYIKFFFIFFAPHAFSALIFEISKIPGRTPAWS
ncbi:hypothetical protein OB13_11095 [Pontibacter sp. HJ8]